MIYNVMAQFLQVVMQNVLRGIQIDLQMSLQFWNSIK